MKVKTSSLIGKQLDWAVAEAFNSVRSENDWVDKDSEGNYHDWNPSISWGQGGPIIQKNLMVISPDPSHNWMARNYMDATEHYGNTPLIAAMRCYVSTFLGEEVDITEFNKKKLDKIK